jgi:hypothetical protein
MPFADSRHFVLTFHDSTMEAIAQGIAVGDAFETVADAVAAMSLEAARDL